MERPSSPRRRWAAAAPAAALASASLLAAAAGVTAALPPPAAAAARPAADSAWSEWQSIPDQYQGAVEIRFRVEAARKDAPASVVYQLRSRYPQRLTLSFRIEGEDEAGPASVDRTVVLEAAAGRDKPREAKEERIALAKVIRLQVASIRFAGKPPAPTAVGAQSDSAETRRLRDEIARARADLSRAYDVQTVATRQYVSARASVEAHKATIRDDMGNRYMMDTRDVAVLQANAHEAEQRVKDIRARLDGLEAQLRATQGLDSGETKLVGTARQAAAAGDWPKAEAIFRSALQSEGVAGFEDADKAALNADLAIALRNQKKYAEAEKYFAKAAELAPQEAAYRSDLGSVLLSDDKPADAEAAIREAVRLRPDDAGYRHDLGIALWTQDKFADAEASFREALRREPGSALYQDGVGVALFSQGKVPEALKAFQEAVRRDPGSADFKAHLEAARERLKAGGDGQPARPGDAAR